MHTSRSLTKMLQAHPAQFLKRKGYICCSVQFLPHCKWEKMRAFIPNRFVKMPTFKKEETSGYCSQGPNHCNHFNIFIVQANRFFLSVLFAFLVSISIYFNLTVAEVCNLDFNRHVELRAFYIVRKIEKHVSQITLKQFEDALYFQSFTETFGALTPVS